MGKPATRIVDLAGNGSLSLFSISALTNGVIDKSVKKTKNFLTSFKDFPLSDNTASRLSKTCITGYPLTRKD